MSTSKLKEPEVGILIEKYPLNVSKKCCVWCSIDRQWCNSDKRNFLHKQTTLHNLMTAYSAEKAPKIAEEMMSDSDENQILESPKPAKKVRKSGKRARKRKFMGNQHTY